MFEFLFCPHENANQLDYFVVFDTLCDTLALIYEKLNLLDVKYDHVYNDLITFDNKIKHHIFSKISKEMHALSEEVVSVQLKTMDNLFESQDGLRAMFQDNWWHLLAVWACGIREKSARPPASALFPDI